MTDLRSFEKRIRFFANKIGEQGDAVTKTASLIALEALAETTPIDEGTAVSNWQVGLGQSPNGVIPPHAPGEHGSTAMENQEATISAGRSVIDRYRSGNTGAIHIVNNVKHIQSLNDGHSAQAPANFIETAIGRARAFIRGFRISYK